MLREAHPEYLSRIVNLLPEFMVNPYSPIQIAEHGRMLGVLRISAVVRVECGARIEVDIPVLATGARGHYAQYYPRALEIACPSCRKTHVAHGIGLSRDIESIEDQQLDCGRTSRLLRAVADYQDHAAPFAETGVA